MICEVILAMSKSVFAEISNTLSILTSSSEASKLISTSSLTIRPEAGDFFVFGAKQLHTVYPYRCEEGDTERRSVSFNAIYETGTTRKRRLEGDNTLPQKRNSGRIG